tara:strand:- start:1194 stop:1670 length:477 start_codon:yes stop_codon:yes gene_type:complete
MKMKSQFYKNIILYKVYMVFYENLSTYDFLSKKYNFEDYMEAFTTAMGILFFVYMLLIAQTEPFILLTIMFGVIFGFLIVIDKKHKKLYNSKLDNVRDQINIIRNKLYNGENNVDKASSSKDNNDEIISEEEDSNDDPIIESISPHNFENMTNQLSLF